MRVLFLTLLVLPLIGCVTTSSRDPEHKALVGTEFELKEEWFLCSSKTMNGYDDRATHSIRNENQPDYGQACHSLPKGTRIEIKEVNKYRNVSIGDTWTGVIMEVTHPVSQETVTVLYFWKEWVFGAPPWKLNQNANPEVIISAKPE